MTTAIFCESLAINDLWLSHLYLKPF